MTDSWDIDDYLSERPKAKSRSTTAGPSNFVQRALSAPADRDDPDANILDDIIGELGGRPPVIDEDTVGETPFQELIRHWMNERHAPEILPAQETLLGRLLDHIRKQTDDVQLLRADPDSSEDEHFRIMLVQTEVERVKFVIRSYIRTRLFKIEKYAKHISTTPELHERLSQGELEHAKSYAKLVESHFTHSVLQSLPPEQQSLEDNLPFMPPMVPEPDITRAVFVRGREDCPPIRVPSGGEAQIKKGDVIMTPYHVVQHLLARGNVELV